MTSRKREGLVAFWYQNKNKRFYKYVRPAKQQYHIVRHSRRATRLVHTLNRLGLGLFLVLASTSVLNVYTYTRAGGDARVHAAVPAELNFQARLLQGNGAIVADGTYSISFNLYTAASGGSPVWNEVHATVTVKSGYLSVYLGSVDNDLDTLNWSQQHWLTMNVNGDGEMNPRLKLTSVPFAFRASQADGITNGAGILEADDIAQLAPSNIQAVNTALAALRINQQGAGLLAQLQGAGNDVFTIANNGDVVSGGDATFGGGSLNLGAATQAGGLVLHDGSSNTGTIQTAALGQNTVYTLPDPGTANAEICLDIGNCGGTGDVNNGGNIYGSAMTLGTNDPFALNLETDGVTRLTIDTSGNAILTGSFTAGTGLTVTAGGAAITGNSTITGTLTGLTGLTSSGTVTFSGLGAGLVQSSSGGVLSSGAVDRNSATFFNTALTVANGGTGAATFTSNAVLYGNGTGALQATAAGAGGQLLIANSSGVPTFTTMSGDATLSDTGVLTIANGAVTNAKLQNSTIGLNYGTNLSGDASAVLGGTLNVNFSATPTFTSVTAGALSSSVGLSLSSGGTGDITFDSASNKIVIASTDTTLQRTAAGSYTIDLNDSSATTLVLNNSGAGAASLNLQDGGLQIAGTSVLTSARALQNLTGISTTGGLVFNSFSGNAGILQVDASGNVSLATAGTTYEVPLTFNNGLTRTSNTVGLGGSLTASTDIALGTNNLTLSGTGALAIGTNSPMNASIYKLDVRGAFATFSSDYNLMASTTGLNAYGYFRSVDTNDTTSRFEIGAYDFAGVSQGGRALVLNQLGGNVGVGSDTTPDALFSVGSTSAFQVNDSGNVIAVGLNNSSGGITNAGSITGVGANITASGALTIASTGGANALTLTSGSGTLVLGSNTLQNASSALTLDVNNAGLSTFNIVNNNGSNLANLDVEGGIFAGNGNAFQVNADGDVTSVFTALNGTSTANGGSGLGTSTSLTLASAANFDVGNYVQVNDANCGGTGINPCYAKITAKSTNTLTISPALRWTNGATVNEYHIPEIGGTNSASTLANRYGRGYFISGVATGNGTTFYNEDSIETSLASFDLLNTGVGTLNIGGAATSLNVGNSGTTVNILGSLMTAATETITAGGGLIVGSGGANITGGLVLNSFGGSAGLMKVDGSGNVSISTAGTDYEVPLTFNNGLTRLSNTVGLGGSLNANTEIVMGANSVSFTGTGNVGIGTNTPTNGVLEVVRNNNAVFPSVRISNSNGGANAYAFNFMASDSAGGLFGVGPGTAGISNLSDAAFTVADGTAGGGLVLSARATSGGGIKFYTNGTEVNERMRIDVSGNVNIGGDATPDALFTVGSTSAFQVNGSGIITAATSSTINGLSINSGSLSGVTGFTQTSGNFAMSGSGTFGTGTGAVSLNGATSVTGSNTFSVGSGLTTLSGGLTAVGSININTTGTASTNIGNATGSVILTGAGIGLNSSLLTRTAAGTTTFNLGDASDTTLTLTNIFAGAAHLNIAEGGLQIAGTTVLTNARVLQNVTFDTSLITSGTLSVVRGGTGLNTLTANGILYASNSSTVAQAAGTAGQVLLANASNVPTFTTLSGDVTINSSGVTTIGANTVALATDTTGNYVATVSVGNGMTVSGVGSENATATIGLDVSATGTTATVTSISGLETDASGLRLLGGCSNNQILKWDGTDWNCSADNTGFSDSRLKENVVNLGSVLDNISGVRVVEYNFKCLDGLLSTLKLDCNNHTGIISQELAAIFPEVVYQNADGYYEVDFGALNFYTLQAVVELANIISANGDAALNNVRTGGTLRLTSAGALQNITGLTVSSGGASISGGLTASGTINLNAGGLLTNTNINTGASTGTVTIGGGLTPLVINSTAFDVSSTGAVSGVTTLNMSGLATIGGGATISGGTVNLNAGGLLTNTNINTGASTGTVTIGGGTATLVINSTAFDVSSTGAVSGVTTLAASGTISTTGGNVFINNATGSYQILRGVTTYTGIDANCGNNQYMNSINVRGGIVTSYSACSGVGLSDERLKENVESVGSTLDAIKDVNTVTFDFDCDNEAFTIMNESCQEGRQTGVLAQQLAEVFPELVYQDDYGYYRVKYDALNIYTLKAVGEIAKTVDSNQNVTANSVATNSTVRLDVLGQLQNITGFQMLSGGASIVGGIDNNDGGITEAGAISGATSIEAETIRLNANGTDNILELKKDGAGVFTVFNTGALELRLDSTQSFTVKDAAGTSIFTIDTTNGQIRIGSGNDSKTVLFTLDSKNDESAEDPVGGVNGSSYYNTKLQRFRCYQDNRWTNCLPVGNLTDPIALGKTIWTGMPYGDTEFLGEPRILPDLEMTHEFKLRLRLTAAAAANATCRLQFAENDNGPWSDMSDGSTGELRIDRTGTFASEWFKIKEEARKEEIILRVMCRGGNGSTTPVFYGVSVQFR